VGRDKGSLTEQQTKGTETTTIQIRRIHKTIQRATLTTHRCHALPCREWVPAALLPPNRNPAWRHMVLMWGI